MTAGLEEIHGALGRTQGTSWPSWGSGATGKLGNGSTSFSSKPAVIAGSTGASRVACGFGHACATKADGTNQLTPVKISGLPEVVDVAARSSHTCAVTKAGGLYCWGANDRGQLADGSKQDRWMPTPVVW